VPGKRIVIDHPRTAKERKALAEFAARTFGGHYDEILQRQVCEIEEAPGARPELRRVARIGGEIAAHVGIIDRTVRIGRARLRMGGLAGVMTDPAHRHRGLASACLEDAVDFMRNDGFDVSFLFGIRDFYHRFGYVGCLPTYAMRLRVRDLERLKNPFAIEAPRGRPPARLLDEIVPLYEAASAGTPASVVRDRACFAYALRSRGLERPKRGGDPSRGLTVFREKRGGRAGKKRVRAYAVLGEGGCLEAGLAPGDDAAAGAVLAWLRDRCVRNLARELVLRGMPPAHPLACFARRFNHTEERGFSWNGDGMGRVVDARRFLDAIAPELDARLSAAGIDDECHLHVTLAPGDRARRRARPVEESLVLGGGHHFAMARRGVRSAKVKCSEGALLQMALGSLAFGDIPGVSVGGDRAFVRAIFPEAGPGLWPIDHF
jgi:predicted N-acetyltransferase YhbS